MSVTRGDFRLWNEWKEDRDGPQYPYSSIPTPQYIIDMTTGRRYLNDTEESIQDKAQMLSCLGPLGSTVVSIIYLAVRIVRLVSCYHFWSPPNKAEDSSRNEGAEKSEEAGSQNEMESSSVELVGLCSQELEEKENSEPEKGQRIFFRDRLNHAGVDLLRLVAMPFNCLGMQFCAWRAACCNPRDGRKLYATLERVQYDGDYFIAPCFQPDPKFHAFGGAIHERDAW